MLESRNAAASSGSSSSDVGDRLHAAGEHRRRSPPPRPVSCSIDSSRVSASSSSESCASSRSSAAESAQSDTRPPPPRPAAVSGMPALSMPSTSVSVASHAALEALADEARPALRRLRLRFLAARAVWRWAFGCPRRSPRSRLARRRRRRTRSAPTRRPVTVSPLLVAVSDHSGRRRARRTTPTAMPTIQASGPRITSYFFPGSDSSSTTPTSSFQKRSTVGMLTRSSGECGPSICGPIASMSRRPLTLLPMTAVSRPAWIAVTTGGSPKSRS